MNVIRVFVYLLLLLILFTGSSQVNNSLNHNTRGFFGEKSKNADKKHIYLLAAELDQSIENELFHGFDRHFALKDPYSRISKPFRVEPSFLPRVQFWYDVYTHYNKHQHIIHHALYPWIIFEVVDTTPFLNGSGPLWLRIDRGNKFVQKRKSHFQQQLRMLARIKNYNKLTDEQNRLLELLSPLPGKSRRKLQVAAAQIRSQLGQQDFFLKGLENGSKYLPLIEEEFEKLNLPLELTRIPFVESSFNEQAQSKVGASGVWQIMPSIGKKYSIVSERIDERNSPVKASLVAAKLFKQNFAILKSWPLAITAYNNGIGNLNKAIKRARSRNLEDIISRGYAGSFKFASSNFYASFLAALHAEKYHQEIFQRTTLEKAEALNKTKYKLSKSWRPHSLAQKIGIEVETLLSLNLDLRKTIAKNTPIPKGFVLFIPKEKAQHVKSQVL